MMGVCIDLGRLEYRKAWDYQLRCASEVILGALDTLIFVEHDPVLTLGAAFHEENLLLTRQEYERLGIAVEPTDRGGDVTYHGPGQLVIYPIFNIKRHGEDLHLWMRNLEEAMLKTIAHFGIRGRRFPPHTGAWVEDRKIAAIGVKVRKWVNTHGIALNCDNDLSAFESIVPCGIEGYGVSSLSECVGRQVGIEEVKPVVKAAFENVFGLTLTEERFSEE